MVLKKAKMPSAGFDPGTFTLVVPTALRWNVSKCVPILKYVM